MEPAIPLRKSPIPVILAVVRVVIPLVWDPFGSPASGTQLGSKEAMKSNYKIGVAVIGSFVLGVGAASVLHAQANPPGYTWAEIDVKDQDGYTKDYLPKVQAHIKEFGGKYLGGGFNKAVGLSGAPPANRVVLIQFPDMDSAKAFSDKDAPDQANVGSKYASFHIMAFPGVEPK